MNHPGWTTPSITPHSVALVGASDGPHHQALLQRLCPDREVAVPYRLAQQFLAMVRDRTATASDRWLEICVCRLLHCEASFFRTPYHWLR